MGGTDCGVDSAGIGSCTTPEVPASLSSAPSHVDVQTGEGVAWALSVLAVPPGS